MRKDLNQLLLAAAILLLGMWLLCWKAFGENWGNGWGILALLLSLHGVALFFLQMFFCRQLRRWWPKALPALLLGGFILWTLWIMAHDSSGGWDRLIGESILWFCVASAVGIALAWGLYVALKYRRKTHE